MPSDLDAGSDAAAAADAEIAPAPAAPAPTTTTTIAVPTPQATAAPGANLAGGGPPDCMQSRSYDLNAALVVFVVLVGVLVARRYVAIGRARASRR